MNGMPFCKRWPRVASLVIVSLVTLGYVGLISDASPSEANNGYSTAATLYGPGSVAVDSSGNVYVADGGNNRVLEYPPTCGSTGCSATRVFGHADFTSKLNQSVSASTFFLPQDVAVDSSGNVYVADTSNNRVLEFPSDCASTGCSATRVFGQTSFTGTYSSDPGGAVSPGGINTPPSPTSELPTTTSVPPSASDTGPPSPPDSATVPTPSAPDSTAVPDTLTDSVRADILAAVDRGNAAWTAAQLSLDPADLQSGLTGLELSNDTSQLAQFRNSGQKRNVVNMAFTVLEVSLDTSTEATVHTQETWSDAVYNSTTGALIRQDPPTNYSETYTVDLIDGQSTVSQIQLQ